ncbi:unnamed protein product [Mytilus edulis]|uniref:Uncharacterized protein n=1 Tax=Mytilus edulis TaxID=6550 RepID=A0A8S3UF72_MYTED|nr:unnamed protein product [Mytilus edulis]
MNHPDKHFVDYLCNGLQYGFDTMVKYDNIKTMECRNNLSARSQKDTVADLINKELLNGFVYGPFEKLPFDDYRVSPLGVAEGKYSFKKRLILDLSAPHNDTNVSINDLIDKDLCSMTYVKIDDAIRLITNYGKGTKLCHLNFASRVIVPGRSFVSYLIKLSTKVKELHFYVNLRKESRVDLEFWLRFLHNWNGINMFYDCNYTSNFDMQLYTDASSTIGYGGYYQGKWFCSTWPKELPSLNDKSLSMAFLELYPIVVAALLWGKEWKCKKILFLCDNETKREDQNVSKL